MARLQRELGFDESQVFDQIAKEREFLLKFLS